MIEVRKENSNDYEAVRIVNNLAFGQHEEGNVVDKIREACEEIISLVAVESDKIVGHILFSPATIEKDGQTFTGMGLAPMAVLPDYQKQGIGSLLVNDGIKRVKQLNFPFVIVLGHPEYYPKFGFERASKFGLKTQWEGIPDEAFMAMILDYEVMRGVKGIAYYRKEFDEAM